MTFMLPFGILRRGVYECGTTIVIPATSTDPTFKTGLDEKITSRATISLVYPDRTLTSVVSALAIDQPNRMGYQMFQTSIPIRSILLTVTTIPDGRRNWVLPLPRGTRHAIT